MCHLNSLQLTRFVELLTTTKLFYDTRLIEFAFEFLNRAGPGSNRHGFPLVFETNASTNSATWACLH